MTEVYSILSQAAPAANSGAMKGLWIFWGVVFFILFISLIKRVTTGNARLGVIIGNVIAMVFIIVACAIIALGLWAEKQTYAEYTEALESGSYSVESGKPSGLEVYTTENGDGKTVYEISFSVNGKYFDSSLAYGEGHFSKSDIRLITSSDTFEVKYIVDEYDDNIILSMSVSNAAA